MLTSALLTVAFVGDSDVGIELDEADDEEEVDDDSVVVAVCLVLVAGEDPDAGNSQERVTSAHDYKS